MPEPFIIDTESERVIRNPEFPLEDHSAKSLQEQIDYLRFKVDLADWKIDKIGPWVSELANEYNKRSEEL